MFYISGLIPNKTTPKDLQGYFKDFQPIEIRWIDSTSAAIIVYDEEKAAKVMDHLGGFGRRFKLIPYKDWKLSQKGQFSLSSLILYLGIGVTIPSILVASYYFLSSKK